MLSDELRAEIHMLSFWDAMIVVTPINGGADVILSEDLNPGKLVVGIDILNPFE
jgi:predicted nucleic acid-binding protein